MSKSMEDIYKECGEWHASEGGHGADLKAHALRTFGEVIEWVAAHGATRDEIFLAYETQIRKLITKAEIAGIYDEAAIAEEYADVHVTLACWQNYSKVDPVASIEAKLPVLHARAWSVDAGGTLSRPSS